MGAEDGGEEEVVVFFFKQETAYEISACRVGSEMCIGGRDAANPGGGAKATPQITLAAGGKRRDRISAGIGNSRDVLDDVREKVQWDAWHSASTLHDPT